MKTTDFKIIILGINKNKTSQACFTEIYNVLYFQPFKKLTFCTGTIFCQNIY